MAELVDPKTLVRALVAAMWREGVAPTRTRLIKFLYLADLHHARYHGGQTITGWRWHVGPFGPVADDGLASFERGIREGWLVTQGMNNDADESGSQRAVIYGLPADDRDVALPPVLGKLREYIKKYGSDTSRLLHFVYGNTEPMEHAQPFDELDFSVARATGPGPVIESPPIDKKKRRRIDEILNRISASAASARSTATPSKAIYDRAFLEGVPTEDTPSSDPTVIYFPRRREN